jgi:ubiquinone biosynthesis protein Coq4
MGRCKHRQLREASTKNQAPSLPNITQHKPKTTKPHLQTLRKLNRYIYGIVQNLSMKQANLYPQEGSDGAPERAHTTKHRHRKSTHE